jgi:hypothetical protein
MYTPSSRTQTYSEAHGTWLCESHAKLQHKVQGQIEISMNHSLTMSL